MHFFEMEWFLIEDRGFVFARVLPGRHVGKIGIIALGLAVFGLIFLAEVTAAGLVAVEGVLNEKLGELQEIRDASRALQRLVEIPILPRHIYVLPELFANLRNLSERVS